MRDKTLGRWMVRLAVTLGTGAFVLGLGSVAANADTSSKLSRVGGLTGTVTVIQQADTAPSAEQIFVTEDWSWG